MSQATSEPGPRGSALALVVAAGGLLFLLWGEGFPGGLLGDVLFTWMLLAWFATAPLGVLVVASRGSWLGVWLLVLGLFYWFYFAGAASAA